MKNLSEQIKKIRKSQKITQEKLAEMVGVSVITVKRWEKDRMPRADEMSKLAAALGTTVGALMGEGEPEPQKNLPINNSGIENKIPNETPEYLDLGYWGNVAENAERAARSSDNGKKAAISLMLRMATDAITGAGAAGTGGGTQGANIFQKADGVHGNVKQSVGTLG